MAEQKKDLHKGDPMDVVRYNQPSDYDPTKQQKTAGQTRERESGVTVPSTGGASADTGAARPGGAAPAIESGKTSSPETTSTAIKP